MKRCIKYCSIEQLRSVITNINRQISFVGFDEKNEPIYDPTIPKPILTFIGTCKLHGTNMGISFNNIDGLWFQSRTGVITPQNDNAGAAFSGEVNREAWLKLLNQVKEENDIDLDNNSITIYGEWVGKSIQKGVGISNLEKSAFIFGVKISPNKNEDLEKQVPSYWVNSTNLRSPENRIYNIVDYGEYPIEIDFNVPQLAQNKIIDLTLQVEKECPIAKAFGFPNTIGEGLVFSCEYKGTQYLFKSKGNLHSKSSVKTLKPVDDERINKIIELSQKVSPNWRMEQMLNETFDFINGGQIDRKKLGDYIKAVINDIIKEESDVIVEAGFEIKDIGKYVSEISRQYFFDMEKELTGI